MSDISNMKACARRTCSAIKWLAMGGRIRMGYGDIGMCADGKVGIIYNDGISDLSELSVKALMQIMEKMPSDDYIGMCANIALNKAKDEERK